MGLKNDILFELSKAEDYISGEALAVKFGKSRAAVWKAVKSLTKEGYHIEAVTNRGYRLSSDNNILSAESVKSHLNKSIDVIFYPSVDSTNNVCKKLVADECGKAFLVVANEQTAGRGRQGKSFYSPSGTGVYFSLVLRPRASLNSTVSITTAAAVAVCRAIESLTGKEPQIKWVNDVYFNGKKVCGILTEAITNFEDGIVDSVIIGIGINISTAQFPESVEGAGSLNADIDRGRLIATVANELLNIATDDYKEFIDYYRTHSMVLGQKIKFIKNSVETPATAVAIDEHGGLEVELESGEHIILRSGEISIRKI